MNGGTADSRLNNLICISNQLKLGVHGVNVLRTAGGEQSFQRLVVGIRYYRGKKFAPIGF